MLLRYVTHFMHTYAIYLTKYVTSISLALYIEWKQNVYRAFYIIEKYSFIILKYEIFGICDCDVIAIEYARACDKILIKSRDENSYQCKRSSRGYARHTVVTIFTSVLENWR